MSSIIRLSVQHEFRIFFLRRCTKAWFKKKLLKQAGLPNIRFHDLRHSAATLLLSLGIHPKVVQEVLGHTQISMTMDIYSHVLPGMQQDAMSKLHDALKRKDDEENGGTVGAKVPTKR